MVKMLMPVWVTVGSSTLPLAMIAANNLFNEYPDKRPSGVITYENERYATTLPRDYLLGSPIGYFGRRLFGRVSYDF